MKCRICNCDSQFNHSAKILNKYDISYYYCKHCGFLQTEEPYWLSESYSDALSISDTGTMQRNNSLEKSATVILSLLTDSNGKFLDYGGGYGIFCRLMRDRGFDFYWYDKYANNLLARGFEGVLDGQRYSAITSFENFEHFLEPLVEIEKILSLTDFVLFSTTLVPKNIPSAEDWWYYCLEHGQHISLYSRRTLAFISEKYGYNFYTNGSNLHIFSKKRVSSYVFLLQKLITKFGLVEIFSKTSRTQLDMEIMIEKMKKIK